MKYNKLFACTLGLLIGAFGQAHAFFEVDLTDIQYAVVGKPAVNRTNVGIAGGVVYETRFNSATLQGDLIARAIDVNGNTSNDVFDELGLLQADGAEWRASRVMRDRDPNTRNIFVAELLNPASDTDGSLTPKVFRWNAISAHTKSLIDPAAANPPDNEPALTESAVLNWLRGAQTNEGLGAGLFRERTALWQNDAAGNPTSYHNKIGPVVRSAPAYVGPPNEFYSENDYFAFRQANRNRKPMVYVGANDGMMHGFIATTGEADSGKEVFGFVPAAVLHKLAGHTSRDASEPVFTVDGSPIVEDAYGPFPACGTGSCWRSILVSGLNGGGRSVFALDVTDPVSDITGETQANANKLFLWEHGAIDVNGDGNPKDANRGENPRLGYTFSQPIIAQLNNGVWAAIYGNGYGAKDGNTLNKGAWLFIRNLATGDEIATIGLYHKDQDDHDPNGLSSVRAWDENFDGRVDYVYAGDLNGNLWKVDLTSTDPSNFEPAFDDPRNTGFYHPLIQVGDTYNPNLNGSITTTPAVTVHPDGGVMVYFGSGINVGANHLFPLGDKSVFGIRDANPNAPADLKPPYGYYPQYTSNTRKSDRAKQFTLTQHTLGLETVPPPAPPAEGGDPEPNVPVLRGIKSTTESTDGVGWEIKLQDYDSHPSAINTNEQLLTDIRVSGGRVQFISTQNRDGENPFNWMNIVDFRTGAAPATPLFDSNLDGSVTEADRIDIVDGGPTDVVPVSGAMGVGVPSTPSIVTVVNNNRAFIVNLGIEIFGIFSSPFTDGGLAGGHFDEDEAFLPRDVYKDENGNVVPIDWDNPPFYQDLFKSVKHTHEYDDKLDVNGVNLLRQVDQNAEPPETDRPPPGQAPNVETTDGILDGYTSLQGGAWKVRLDNDGNILLDNNGNPQLRDGEFEDDAGNPISENTVAIIELLNPHSVDHSVWAQERFEAGVSGNNHVAQPARVYFACDDPTYMLPDPNGPDAAFVPGGTTVSGPSGGPVTNETGTGFAGGWSAPDFFDMPEQYRTCTIKNMTALMVRYNDINAMRATSPGCVKGVNQPGPILPPDQVDPITGAVTKPVDHLGNELRQNSRERDGAFTVRAFQRVNGVKKVFYENWNYEHFKEGPTGCTKINEGGRKNRKLPDSSANEDPCRGKTGEKLIKCRNKNPGSGQSTGGSGKIQFAGEGGFALFVGTPALALDPYAGATPEGPPIVSPQIPARRVNWREVLTE
ncbi:MAG: hypothetical protein HKN50_05375 [Gammaproteobacteria bacterium]|nr:hypothetical protein [Gammaproteobacteria bacterium]